MIAYRKKGKEIVSLQEERERIVSLQEEREKNDKLPGRKMIKIAGRN